MNVRPFTRPAGARAALATLARHRLLPIRWIHKLYRACLPRSYKHFSHCGPRFHLAGDGPDLDRAILWDGAEVGRTQSLTAIENRHADQACFVLGTGPSIKTLDLSRLKPHAVMGVNGAIAVMTPHGLRPRHYTVTDVDFFENRFAMVREVMESGCDCFLSAGGIRCLAEREPKLLTQAKHLYLSEVVNRPYGKLRRSQSDFLEWARAQPGLVLPEPPRHDDSRVGWSRDPRQGVFCSRTILFRALQIAAFLGYRRLYVLGMDLNYKGPAARAYEEGASTRPTKIERDFEPFILPAFRVLQGEIDAGTLEVYNLSDASRLPPDILPRMSFDDALKREKQTDSAAPNH